MSSRIARTLNRIWTIRTTKEDHGKVLKFTLAKLKAAGLTINDAKCELEETSVTFLGRTISGSGVEPLPAAINAIQACPQPHHKTSLRSFLGTAGFYRQFIHDYASITTSLFELVKDNVKLEIKNTPSKTLRNVCLLVYI